VKGIAGVDEIRGLFTHIPHGGTPYEEEDEECGERIRSLTGGPEERYPAYSVMTLLLERGSADRGNPDADRARGVAGIKLRNRRSEDHRGSAEEPQKNRRKRQGDWRQ